MSDVKTRYREETRRRDAALAKYNHDVRERVLSYLIEQGGEAGVEDLYWLLHDERWTAQTGGSFDDFKRRLTNFGFTVDGDRISL